MEKNERTPKLSTIIISIILVFIGISQYIEQSAAGNSQLFALLCAVYPIYFGIVLLFVKKESQKKFTIIGTILMTLPYLNYSLDILFDELLGIIDLNKFSLEIEEAFGVICIALVLLLLPDTNAGLDSYSVQVKHPRTQKYIKKRGITEDEYIAIQEKNKPVMGGISIVIAIMFSLMTKVSLLFVVCVALILFINNTAKKEIVFNKKNFIFAACGTLICVACVCIALFSNLVTADILDNTITVKGKDIVYAVHSVFDFSELSLDEIASLLKDPAFIKDSLKYELSEIFGIVTTDIFDNEELKMNSVLLFIALISGAMLVILSVVWAFRAIKELLGRASNGKPLPIFTAIIATVFTVSLIILTNSWTEYSSGYIEVKTGTVFGSLCIVLACVIFIVVKKPELSKKIVDALSNIFNNISRSSERVKIENLAAYKELLDKGAITEEEYEAKKEEILRKKN